MPASPGVWFAASRPKTWAAAIAPVVMGTALAMNDGGFHLWAALAALLGAVFIQIGTNFANDYFDFVKGADTDERLGPTRATQAGLIAPKTMRNAFLYAFSIALCIGIYLTFRAGWPVVAIGLFAIVLGITYTGGPVPLGYVGLADIAVLIFFGPVAVAGTHYVQTLALSWPAVLIGLGPGFFSVALLTVNNLRDIETDTKAGKRTLAVRLGAGFAKGLYVASVILACLVPAVVTAATTGLDLIGWLLPVLICAALYGSVREVMRAQPGNRLLKPLQTTGGMMMVYAIAFFGILRAL